MKKVTIAELNIEIDNIDETFFNYRLRKYVNNYIKKPDLRLKVNALDNIPKPKGLVIGQVSDATILKLCNNKYCRYLVESKTGNIFNITYYNDSYSEVLINLCKSVRSGPSLTEYEYIYTGFAFSDMLTMSGGAVLHGSSVVYKNQGIVFSANSGIGKSTHANLWKERFGNDIYIINDDKPAIRFYDGIPYIFGTPWSGKSDLNENTQVQLKSIVFIERAITNRIELLNSRDSIFKLMKQISRPYYDENIGLKTMDVIEKLVKAVPIYKLYCNISQEAVNVVFERLIKEGDIIDENC